MTVQNTESKKTSSEERQKETKEALDEARKVYKEFKGSFNNMNPKRNHR